ncbi:MAG TPA: hypothetical protein DEG17_06275 [Cyanobacteria bacterium UBA11149]|nr:hypothetical protein [Cyanobacteria bacterium UBA11367]HBE59704.1 hypothetical protein [Cyanobacteria bacterium UBA11366]HBK63249.1 hypothetical protein [Cyanobacteria bacterium UBA11166]HBR76585.1 hypothetical protein [Cyanobacteria bacterium UBA11159]HBS69506.1 hypothetical protein [Cyanobacteria bacterium UBA11153]HBW88483.1 hypothetical protein [Cyanobacteria bacterium UBA11149]HCA94318.1 hypothetical protein [Cyanobacteria bacterium UBA9226]
MSNNLRVFVYGTLKPGEVNYQRYCQGKVLEEKSAIAYGTLFNLSLGYPAMTLGENIVRGFVLTFPDSSIFSLLDDLEDYNPHRLLEENEYYRQEIEIYDLDGKSLGLAWAYLMTLTQIHRFNGAIIPSGQWTVDS